MLSVKGVRVQAYISYIECWVLRVLGCLGLYSIYRVLGAKGVRVLGPILYYI